jgi:hypothetical protein
MTYEGPASVTELLGPVEKGDAVNVVLRYQNELFPSGKDFEIRILDGRNAWLPHERPSEIYNALGHRVPEAAELLSHSGAPASLDPYADLLPLPAHLLPLPAHSNEQPKSAGSKRKRRSYTISEDEYINQAFNSKKKWKEIVDERAWPHPTPSPEAIKVA